jgi:hypothetical protein
MDKTNILVNNHRKQGERERGLAVVLCTPRVLPTATPKGRHTRSIFSRNGKIAAMLEAKNPEGYSRDFLNNLSLFCKSW